MNIILFNIVIYFIGIIICIMIFAVPPHFYLYKNYHYICKKNLKPFKPSSFLQSFFGFNYFNKRILKCPYCNKLELVVTKKD